MKTRLIIPALSLVSTTFFMMLNSSCKKEEKINVNQLTGKWYQKSNAAPGAVDGSVSYTFDGAGNCVLKITDFIGSGNDTTINRTYVLSNDQTLITLYNEKKIYTEQYRIKKLTKSYMKWENESPNDGNVNVKEFMK
ncbi:hypothetical protein GQF61_05645 [Sphingobacterium sp. DK4209]|uniref:Lipocalin-like domain-containing protein n=1 Tax=Sphingobacterium zhuxiongii TaxID=2662364 RepID=A0A5Q0Q8N0_9SPHI|nr:MULTISPECIES: hypothetical protein [unclassified Sphingobacterium]MVZ65330.1 hypothetical protein [Sphingobacterium sp. DK4209]QGA26417.1 hypothetical protein GFH32_08785 [Sphingobacterium sp. dk4302]